MKKFKGTKGPWKHRHSENNEQWVIIGTIPGARHKIARCPYINVQDGWDKDHQEANAKLISAAPDLLDACELQRKFIESIMPQIGGISAEIGLLNNALISSKKAIEKALS